MMRLNADLDKYDTYMKHYFYLLLTLLLVACTQPREELLTLTILHTNDTHSQIEPLGSGSSNAGKAGYARRMGLIAQEREADAELILVDAGDFCQGTPYFNFFKGKVEVDALNRMGYDVVGLGNHEFDYGVDSLAKMLEQAEFQVVCANYTGIENTALKDKVQPYVILHRKGLKIGVLGVGVQPAELITPSNFAPLVWVDPLPVANEIADRLREKEHCDVVICLSHLGTDAKNNEFCDQWLAENTRNIDVIIGGHTHKVVTNRYVTNAAGKEVLLSQMGKSGANVGKITLTIAE